MHVRRCNAYTDPYWMPRICDCRPKYLLLIREVFAHREDERKWPSWSITGLADKQNKDDNWRHRENTNRTDSRICNLLLPAMRVEGWCGLKNRCRRQISQTRALSHALTIGVCVGCLLRFRRFGSVFRRALIAARCCVDTETRRLLRRATVFSGH